MSIPRLAFLYPSSIRSFRVAIQTQRRFRHGTAVEPTDLHSSQPPPLPPAPPPSTPPSSHSASSPPPIPSPPLQSPSQLDISDAKFSKRLQAVAEDVAGIGETKKTDGDSIVQEKVKTDLSVIGNETKKSDDSTGVKPSRSFSHHFDTYSFVKRLEHSEGFTYGQSVAMMKDTRSLLELNLEDARKNFVSKSDIENEMYLFQAACSALRNEMQTKKKVQLEQLRTEQTRIQTEYDLLNQRFLGEMMALKDELNGMFHDRKMVTRAEQRAMENKIQELNYKITVLINTDLKSEIEKFRWITTRRGLIAIVALALFVVASIRLNNSSHDRAKKKEQHDHNEHRSGGNVSKLSTEADVPLPLD